MTWVRLDDQFSDHPKIVTVGPLAAWLYVCGLCYCGRYLTDGFIPANQVHRLADIDGITPLVTALVTNRLWSQVEGEGGYMVHDYLKYNPSREEVEAERAENARRQAEWRDKHGKQARNGVTNAVSNPVSNTRPVPDPDPHPQPHPDPQPEPRAITPTIVNTHSEKPSPSGPQPGVSVKPFDVFTALCDETGTEPGSVPKSAKNITLRFCKEMLDAGHSPDRIVRCYRYLSKERWRDGPVDAATVTKKIAWWVTQGEPTEPQDNRHKSDKPKEQEEGERHDDAEYENRIRHFGK